MKKKKIKLIVISILISLFIVITPNVKAEKTGYDEYSEIEFLEVKKTTLLVNMENSEKEAMLKGVRRRAFGWSSYINISNVKVLCTSDVIFSRSNLTRDNVHFTYKTVMGRSNETSKSYTGTLGSKISGKIKSVSTALDLSIRGEIGEKAKTTFDETSTFTINIYPYTRVSLIVMVEGNLSQGASKSFFLGIPTKKGTWEYIDVVCEYYELREEVINK